MKTSETGNMCTRSEARVVRQFLVTRPEPTLGQGGGCPTLAYLAMPAYAHTSTEILWYSDLCR